jgi:hypothetical protein
MTFLEVVVASALLGVVSAAVFSVFGFVGSSQSRDYQRLAAMEVANRLMLAYLDDPVHMPDSSKTVDYGGQSFRWAYVEEQVALNEVAADQRDTSRSSPLSQDRFRAVTIEAWLSEKSGGVRTPDSSTPMAKLVRIVDPTYARNPDSFMNMIQDPEGFRQLMSTIVGGQSATVTRGGLPGGPGGPNTARQAGQRGPLGGQFGPRQGFFQGQGRGFQNRGGFNQGGFRGRTTGGLDAGGGR